MATKKLARHRVETLYRALQAMDGEQEVLRNKDDQFVGTRLKPYEFGKKTVKEALAATQASLEPIVEAIAAGRNSLIKKHLARFKDTAPKDVPQIAVTELNEAVQAYLSMRIEVPVRRVKYGDLRAEENRLPASVLLGLMPITLDFPAEVEESGVEYEEPTWNDPEPAKPADAVPSVNGKAGAHEHEPEAVGA